MRSPAVQPRGHAHHPQRDSAPPAVAALRVVLAAIDLNAGAHAALEQAHKLAARHEARLVVVHALPDVVGVNMLFPQHSLWQLRRAHALLDEAELAVREQVELVTGRPSDDVEIVVTHGRAADAILEVASRVAADLIVVGDNGAGAFGAWRRRTMKTLLRGASVPLLVARPHRSTGVTLAATDFSSAALPALRAGAEHAEHAEQGDGRLIFFHCVDYVAPMSGSAFMFAAPLRVPDAILDLARCRLSAEAVDLGAPAAEPRVEFGGAATEILRVARMERADLVVVRKDDEGALGRMVFGSVAEAVAVGAEASVLVVDERARAWRGDERSGFASGAAATALAGVAALPDELDELDALDALDERDSASEEVPRVLIVDDDPDERDLLAAVLLSIGFDVLQAADGEEAIAILRDGDGDARDSRVDLVISDLQMPRRDGLSLMTAIREVNEDLPFIVVSGSADADARRMCTSAGVHAIVAKPFDVDALCELACDATAWRPS